MEAFTAGVGSRISGSSLQPHMLAAGFLDHVTVMAYIDVRHQQVCSLLTLIKTSPTQFYLPSRSLRPLETFYLM